MLIFYPGLSFLSLRNEFVAKLSSACSITSINHVRSATEAQPILQCFDVVCNCRANLHPKWMEKYPVHSTDLVHRVDVHWVWPSRGQLNSYPPNRLWEMSLQRDGCSAVHQDRSQIPKSNQDTSQIPTVNMLVQSFCSQSFLPTFAFLSGWD